MKKISIALLLFLFVSFSQYRVNAFGMGFDAGVPDIEASRSSNIVVGNGVTYILTQGITLGNSDTIKVLYGGTFVVDGCTIQNANFQLVSGSTVILRNNASVIMAAGKEFLAPAGAVVEISEGTIE